MQIKYEGHEQLSVMSLAKFYNQTLYSFINKDINSNQSILDFGAGIGEFSNRFTNQKRVYVVEQDDIQLNMSHTKNKFKSIQQLEKQKFDLIYSLNVLEHIQNDKEIIQKLSTHLNTNGEFRIFVPAKMELYSSMDKAVGHFRRYERDELIKLFTLSDFKIISCTYFDFLGYFAALIYKFFGNKDGDISEKSILFYDKVVFPISLFIDKISFGKLIGKNLMLIARKVT